MKLLSLYERLEKLLQRLPESMHKPLLRELGPVKALFLAQRAPRVVLLGQRAVSRSRLVNALLGGTAAEETKDAVQGGAWTDYSRGCGTLRLLDARRPAYAGMFQRPLTVEPADYFLFVRRNTESDLDLKADLDQAVEVIEFADQHQATRGMVLGIITGDDQGDEFRHQLQSAMLARPALAERNAGVLPLSDRASIIHQIAIGLPTEAQLEMARLSHDEALQRQIAGTLIKSVTALSGIIGAQPIPLADFPILMTLQATMVGSIMHISGRERSFGSAAEFIAALGTNIGAGLVLREGARAAVKLIPGWGSAISGGVAAAGTYAVGRSAVAYFIDGMTLKDARHLLRRKRSHAAPLHDRSNNGK